MRMFSVLVNSGADPTLEDCRGHNAQYYMDNQSEIVIPEWTNRWSNMITAQDRSPSPERRQEQINYRTVKVHIFCGLLRIHELYIKCLAYQYIVIGRAVSHKLNQLKVSKC